MANEPLMEMKWKHKNTELIHSKAEKEGNRNKAQLGQLENKQQDNRVKCNHINNYIKYK